MYDFISLSLPLDEVLALTPNNSERSLFTSIELAENLLTKIAI